MTRIPPDDQPETADVENRGPRGRRGRKWLVLAGLLVVVASLVTGVLVLLGSEPGEVRRVRAMPPGAVTRIALGEGDSRAVVGGGAAWIANRDGIQRIDPATGTVTATIAAPGSPVAFEGGRVWLLALDRDRRCEAGPTSTFSSYSPYVVSAIDAANDTVVSVTELSGTCSYLADNRSPGPQSVSGGGSIWINEPRSCSVFEIIASTGAIGAKVPLSRGRVVASDADGAWRISPPPEASAEPAESLCAYEVFPTSQLDRIDHDGAVTAENVLPDARTIAAVSADDRAGWVTYFATLARPEVQPPRLARVDATTGAVTATAVMPGSVEVGEGEVWSLGSFPNGPSAEAAGAKPGLLAQLDPATGTIVRSFELDVRADEGLFPKVIAVTDGAVWIDTLGSPGPRELIGVHNT